MIYYNGDNKKVIEAIEIANDLLMGMNSFYLNIERKRELFDLSNVHPKVIAKDMKYTHNVFDITYEEYKPWWRWSRVIGYYTHKKPFVIHVNTYKLRSMSTCDIVGNIVHEFIHLVDHLNGEEKYHHHKTKHNPNSKNGKENTAPYWIGNYARNLCNNVYTTCENYRKIQ